MKSHLIIPIVAVLFATSANALGTNKPNPLVGGAEMDREKTIFENARASSDHTVLVAALEATGLNDTLSGSGPVTVFAPTNAAFESLPDGVGIALMLPENRDRLAAILSGHVVDGKLSAYRLHKLARNSHDGFYHFNAVTGDALSAQARGRYLYIFDESGNATKISVANVRHSNGIMHVVEKVLLPLAEMDESS